jgi:hypothetical protein
MAEMKFRAGTALGPILPLAGAALLGACTVIAGGGGSTGMGTTGAGGSGGGSTVATSTAVTSSVATGIPPGATGKDVFNALEPDILGECGPCHKLGGPADAPFLALPDVYNSITSWPGIIVPIPSQSLILTHPADPTHGGGQAPDMSKELRAKVLPWLTLEASEIPTPMGSSKAYITPFKPLIKGAYNTVYLDPLGQSLTSSSLSFSATEVGDPPTMLVLSHIEAHPVADTTLHLVHPLFSVYPDGGGEMPDPIDSFSNVDALFSIGDDPTIGTGTLILTNWSKGARLGLAFDTAEVTGSGTPLADCKNLAGFKKEVVPQLQHCAMNCHSGMMMVPTAAMDLTQLMAKPDIACAQVKARINPDDPPSSDMLIVTDPSKQVKHGYKFGGDKQQYGAFKTAVTPWIISEK